jgi:hypothetical protein
MGKGTLRENLVYVSIPSPGFRGNYDNEDSKIYPLKMWHRFKYFRKKMR